MKLRLIEIGHKFKIQIEKDKCSYQDIGVYDNHVTAGIAFNSFVKDYEEFIEKGIMDKNGEFIVKILEEVEIPKTISNDKN